MRDIPRTAFLVIIDVWVVAVLMLILSVSGCATIPANFREDAISGKSTAVGAAATSAFQWKSQLDERRGRPFFEQC